MLKKITIGSLVLTSFSYGAETPVKELPSVLVESKKAKGEGYLQETTSLNYYSSEVKDTPQSITIVPKKLMQDQGSTTVKEGLKNVAGISFAAGEGGAQGDNLTLRGFTARSDFYIDGMRDYGNYFRDPFNTEQIDVIKGPSSIFFGRGSTGGIINQESKVPQNKSFTNADFVLGTDNTKRVTVDTNQKLEGVSGGAVRLNIMGHTANVSRRDVTENKRFGFAPTISLGSGSPTRFVFSYLHQSENNIPDYGLPWVLNKPANVPANTYYGFKSGNNFFKSEVDIVTAKLDHDFNSETTLTEQVRYISNKRNMQVTRPWATDTLTSNTVSVNPNPEYVYRGQLTSESKETYLTSQTSLKTKFYNHNVVSILELGYETSSPTSKTYIATPNVTLINPNINQDFTLTGKVNGKVHTNATTIAIGAVDTINLGKKWDLIIGGRIDRFNAKYENTLVSGDVTKFERLDIMPSYRAGIVYKIAPNGSIYVSTGTSFNPSAEALSLSASTVDTEPEKNQTYEAGTKWEFFDKQLKTSVAVFRTDKLNAREVDANNPLLTILSGKQRVEGIELEVQGQLSERFNVFASYVYMKSELVSSKKAGWENEVGRVLGNVPKHTFNFWGTYNVISPLELGLGLNAVSERMANTTPVALTGETKRAPGYASLSAMLKYEFSSNLTFQANIYNLTNAYYFDTIGNHVAIPAPSRYLLLTTKVKF